MPETPTFDAGALLSVLDGRYHDIRELTRKHLVEHADLLTAEVDQDLDTFRTTVMDAIRDMAATGMLGMGFPEQYGGGGDIGASVAGFETMATGDLSALVKVGVQFGLFGGAILHLGTDKHHEKYLEDLISASLLGCFAMTEYGHGSNVQHLATVAAYDGETGDFVLTTPDDMARKDYIGGAGRDATVAAVFAQLEIGGRSEGVHCFVVPIRDEHGDPLPGVRTDDDGHKMGLKGVDNGRLWFDGVRVPRENLLNRYADVTAEGEYVSSIENASRRFFTTLGTLVQGRVCVGGGGINAAKVALVIAVKYALLRRQFGEADAEEELLLDYGLHQRRLFPRIARIYAMHFAQEVLAEELHDIFSLSGGPEGDEAGDQASEEVERRRRALESRAAGTKALGTWLATDVIQECREACGGAGYLAENRFAALKADTDVFTTFEGDNHVLLQLVAKGLLTDYSSSFEDLDQLGMVRFVADLAVETVLERTAAHKVLERVRDLIPGAEDRGDAGADLYDADYQLAMLRWREEHMLGGVARRLKRGIDNKMPPVVVFSRCQDHVIAAARAHVERLVLEAFTAKVDSVPDGGEKDALVLLRDLYALAVIEEDRAWFMEHGRLSSARAKSVSHEVGRICRRVRPVAEQYVDAFGIPVELYDVPLLHPGEDR